LNTKLKTLVKLVNVSDGPHRLHILAPKSPNWKISYQKRGRISAGMSEEVQVEFIGREYRRYEETFTVLTEKSSFAVQMEAVPSPNRGASPNSPQDSKQKVLLQSSLHLQEEDLPQVEQLTIPQNSLIFPSRIDFGKCLLHHK
jgi:hypothetical protein